MNLQTTLSVYGGGPGSGCKGPNCGRPGSEKEKFDVFYHGTVLPSAKAILKEGLKPTPEKSFKIEGLPLRSGYVYVTRDEGLAKEFAKSRSNYDVASPGTHVQLSNFFDHRVVKSPDAAWSSKKQVPAIVELDVPKKVASKFQGDPDWTADDDQYELDRNIVMINKGIIPKDYVAKVSVMNADRTWRNLSKEELAASKSGLTLYLVYYGPLDALKRHLKAGVKK